MLYPQMNAYRTIYDMNGFWRFKADIDVIGEKEQWHTGVPGDREIAVPASWNEQYDDLMYFMGTGWYQKEFELPLDGGDKTYWLRVGSANYYTKVWVNGHYAGHNEGAHLPFEFDITSYLNVQDKNTVVISVDAAIGKDRLPPGDVEDEMIVGFKGQYPNNYYDFFPYGGIQRPVQIIVKPRTHIAKLMVRTDVNEANTAGSVHYQVHLNEQAPGNVRIVCDGQVIESAVDRKGMAEGIISVSNAQLWSPASPNLYEFTVQYVEQGEVKDKYSQQIGIRRIEIKGNQLLLNGEPVFLRGVGMHEDFPVLGKGLSHAVIAKDISLIKWLGGNSLRTTHYPYSEEFLQHTDKEGILVIGESPFVGFVKSHYKDSAIIDKAAKVLTRMVERDCCHPSIIAWSLANEPDSLDEGAGPFFKTLYDTVKGLDSSRPITFVNCVDPDKDTAMQHMDFVSLNRYYGWYEQAGRLDEGCEVLDKALDRCHERFGKPIIITEYGADAMAGVHTNPPELFSEEYQAEMLTRQYRIIKDKPYSIGAHVWALADFKTSQTPSRVVVNRKGMFTRERQPKLSAHRVKQLWDEEK